MGYVILIVMGYFLLKICGKVLRKVCSAETTALWLVALGFCFVGLSWLGLLILAWKYLIIPIGNYCERQQRQKRRSGGTVSNESIMWLIPIFWPFLIAKMFFGGKQYKPSLDEYDYEQHLKSNGK